MWSVKVTWPSALADEGHSLWSKRTTKFQYLFPVKDLILFFQHLTLYYQSRGDSYNSGYRYNALSTIIQKKKIKTKYNDNDAQII